LHWIFLTAAILLEISGTTAMKLSNGFTKLVPSILMACFYIASLACLTFALKKIDVSIAYAIWSGLGTALIAAIGVFYFNEPSNTLKIVFIALIKFGGSGYMDSLYSSGGGYFLMSIALIIIAISVVVSRKIFEIRV